MTLLELKTNVYIAHITMKNLEISQKRIEEMDPAIYACEGNARRIEIKIMELEYSFFKNIFRKSKVKSEVKNLQETIQKSLRSAKIFREIIKEDEKNILECEQKLDSFKKLIPERFFKLEVMRIFNNYLENVKGVTVEEAIRYMDKNYGHLMFAESNASSNVEQFPYGTQNVDSDQDFKGMGNWEIKII